MAKAAEAFAEYVAYIEDTIEDRRKNPQDDLVSILVNARDGGAARRSDEVVDAAKMPSDHATEMAKDELTMFLVTLLIAGNETTRNALTGGMSQLIENPGRAPEADRQPGADPDRRRGDRAPRLAGPELRPHRDAGHRAPRQEDRRRARRSSSCTPPPTATPTSSRIPTRFKVDRDPNPHVAFGIGNHFCLGANLARMEIRVVLGGAPDAHARHGVQRRAAVDAPVAAGAFVHAHAGALHARPLTTDVTVEAPATFAELPRRASAALPVVVGARWVPGSCGWRSPREAASSSGGRT